jgi:hypothetical protein|nr:MAG TPA: hypothetical protein [Caudoviricetes sp.]
MNDAVQAIIDYYDSQIESSEIIKKYFIEKKRVVMSKNNINDDSKEGMSVDEFGAEIANIYGYKSFDDVSNDDKYAALTLWKDHIKNR